MFLAKYDNNGTCQWAQGISGTDSETFGSIALDSLGNCYIAGDFYSSKLNFNNGIFLSNNGNRDALIAKYECNGTCSWAQGISGNDYDYVCTVNVDKYCNIYAAGGFSSNILNFNNNISLSNNGKECAFLSKYDSNGICQWAQKTTGLSAIEFLCLDNNCNIYLAGVYDTTGINFNNNISLSNNGKIDDFISKYDNNGICQWAQKIAGTDNEMINGLRIDNYGNIFATGESISDTLSFDDSFFVYKAINYELFITKYYNNGNLRWVKIIDGTNDVIPQGMTVDRKGNFYLTGYFLSDTIIFSNEISLFKSWRSKWFHS